MEHVNHPKHYNSHPNGIECIDIIRHYVCDIANAIKYLWRAGLKVEIGMDEPDRNLDIENIGHIKSVLDFHKPHTQIIAVVHNPLLICALSKNPEVNFIEMTRGYVKNIRKMVKELV